MVGSLARVWLAGGALCGFSGVAMSALAAHALPGRLDGRALAAVQSAIAMQGWHAAALLFTALWCGRVTGTALLLAQGAGGAFLLGVVLFSGAIYLADIGGVHPGPVAPIGGTLLMAGWLMLAASALTARG